MDVKQFELPSICTKKIKHFPFFFRKKSFHNLFNAAQYSKLNIYSGRILLCSNSYHTQIQFQYFVAFEFSSSSLQCYSVSFCSCVITYVFEFYSDFVCAICSIHLSPLVRGRMNQNLGHRKQKKSNQHNFVGSMRVSFFFSGSLVFSPGSFFFALRSPNRKTVRPKRNLSDRRAKK